MGKLETSVLEEYERAFESGIISITKESISTFTRKLINNINLEITGSKFILAERTLYVIEQVLIKFTSKKLNNKESKIKEFQKELFNYIFTEVEKKKLASYKNFLRRI